MADPNWCPLCYRMKGGRDGKCGSYMAAAQRCVACRACSWNPVEEVGTCNS